MKISKTPATACQRNRTLLVWPLGLQHKDALGRAGVARVLGEQKDVAARGALEALLGDAHWLVRANAAQALSRHKNRLYLPALATASSAARIALREHPKIRLPVGF